MQIPENYKEIWEKAAPLLKQGRPGDDSHALEVVEFILTHGDPRSFDVLVPVAILHDIGHSAILPEHFKFITGQERVMNGKLVHMLVGAKIAKDILDAIRYDPTKAAEIIEIVSMHDADQLENTDVAKVYDSENKKMFHDIDCMDRYNAERLKKMEKVLSDKDKMFAMLEKGLEGFFYKEFRDIAEAKLKDVKKMF
jgi:hypothetical protein